MTANNLAPAGAEGLDHDFVAGKSSSPRWGGFPGRVDQSQGFAKSAHPWLSSFGSSGEFNARVFNLHRVVGGNTIMEHYPLGHHMDTAGTLVLALLYCQTLKRSHAPVAQLD